MQAEAILDKSRSTGLRELTINKKMFEKPIGLIGRVFGCWHQELSRPFTNERESYRMCLHCGAHRRFDTETFKTYGPYYFNVAGQK